MDNALTDFGSKLFDEKVMKDKLPSPIYNKWKETVNKQDMLDRVTADAIAHAMKEWAISQGCTHFTHWFQPLTGVTAEKHDSFIDISEGKTILKFSGKNLIKGEPDASSFPTGGLRATFEARGYTYWDCTSPAFIKDNILCIPTIFVSFNGEALDTKEPLLKSIDYISRVATKLMNLFGNKEVTSVIPYIGLEQEYFLVDKKDFLNREDLIMTGKTLFGAMPPKGQELDDHYFGKIPTRVHEFMKDVNSRLWKLGVYAKSEHNEVAPAQFELAPIFANANISVDQNQIIMETLQMTALEHNMVCLLHEKPFKGVNGSGKHNNWSLITNTGVNLLDPGKNPHENIQFLVVLCAIIKAIDKHSDIIRLFSSCPGNDYRLGANEAPPAIISMFLGSTIDDVLSTIQSGKPTTYEKSSLKSFGISTLSYLPKDNSDRNRTSPIAFTGNKFEFRSLGSSMNAGSLNIAINSIVAESLEEITNELESHKYRQDIREAALSICVDILKEHSRIIFSGDGYSQKWIEEANTRGLPNIKTFVEAIKYFEDHNSGEVFIKNGIFTKEELEARIDVLYESYYKQKSIELKTMIDMMRGTIMPCVNEAIASYSLSESHMPKSIKLTIYKLASFIDYSEENIIKLESVLEQEASLPSSKEKGLFILKEGIPYQEKIRASYDAIEPFLRKDKLPYPKYDQLLFALDY